MPPTPPAHGIWRTSRTRAQRTLALAACVAGAMSAVGQTGGFDPGQRADMSMPRFEPLPLFFPPIPPPLGRAVARSAAGPGRSAAPPELAAYVNEPFYPVLGTRLATKTLSDKLRAQLDRYRGTKLALQAELRAELQRIRDFDATTRARELAGFARKQTPKLVEIEHNAEQLRRDLINSDNTWTAIRQWRLGDKERRGFSPLEIAQVMRGYAYYDVVLLPAQRRLLREIFLELANAADTAENAQAAQPYLFFSPEPARVLLPDNLPPAVAAKVAAYQTRKSTLKKELYDAIYTQDGKQLSFLRTNALKSLAAKQARPLAELDALAEEIRVGLGEFAEPTAITERSPLPPVLHQRVAAMMTTYAQVQKDAAARIDAIVAEIKDQPIQTSYRFEPDGVKYVVVPARGRGGRGGAAGADTMEQVNAVRARLAAIADEYGQAVARLINEKDAIRQEIAQTLGTTNTAAADRALAAASRVVTANETADSYREYRLAVFQAGLSPEQRRLLFDSVVEHFELPLPRGELQPDYRASTW